MSESNSPQETFQPSLQSEIPPKEEWTIEWLNNSNNFKNAVLVDPAHALQVIQPALQTQTPAPPPVQQSQQPNGIENFIAALQNLQSQPRSFKSTKLPDPDLYDGSPEKLKPFIAALTNKVSANQDHFPNDTYQVQYAYSRLAPQVANRMRNEFRNLIDPAAPVLVANVSTFILKLKQYYDDPSRVDRANKKVWSIRQLNRPFTEFLAEFEDALYDSDYADNREIMIPRLRDACSQELRQTFIVAKPPGQYDAFVQHCITKDSEIRCLAQPPPRRRSPEPMQNKSSANTTRLQTTSPPTVSRRAPPLPPKPMSLSSAPTEKTVSQGGDRMDLDKQSKERTGDNKLTETAKEARRKLGRCLRCNVEGHIAQNCPGRVTVRQVESTDESSAPPAYESQLKE